MIESLFIRYPLEAAVSTEAQIAEIRRMLQLSLNEVSEVEPDACDLESLITELLARGVTRQEIAFLIAESMPLSHVPAKP